MENLTASRFKTKIHTMAQTLRTVIVFFQDGRRPHKYRNVNVEKFTHYARRVGAWYANVYDPVTKQYTGRVYYQQKGPR